jgi:nicotinamide-nucleotide amidase
VNAEIICVGTELLLGDVVNTNSSYISKELSKLGINVYFTTVVGDNVARLEACLNLARTRSDIIITTGGLGPTVDDLTKETVAEILGIQMVLDEKALEMMTSFFDKLGRPMSPNNRKQAFVPEGSVVLYNDLGTAPGCMIMHEEKTYIILPGPPREMRHLFEKYVYPYYSKLSNEIIVSHVMRVMGIGESSMEAKVKDLIDAYENPTIAPYAVSGESYLRITAKAHSKGEADKLIIPVLDKLKERLGISVYGIDIPAIEHCVFNCLNLSEKKIAFAESCTGGLLAKRMTDIPGSSEVFNMGLVTYSNEAKMKLLGVKKDTLDKFGAVSYETAKEMVLGLSHVSGADICVSVTGIAGPGGGTEEKPVGLAYIGVYDGRRLWIKRSFWPKEREQVRLFTANMAFDMVRKMLITAR